MLDNKKLNIEKKEFHANDNTNRKNNKKSFLLLIINAAIGLLIRLYYFPYNIPFTYDALDYFSYAISMSQVGHFPNGWPLANNGWPAFVSIFFSILNYENFIDYIHAQRILSVIISVSTIIPVYLLSKKFFNNSYSIIASSLFIFHPQIINNSLLGVTESLYLFLVVTSIVLFLSKNKYQVHISFIIIGLAAITRYEGLLLVIPFSIIFFIRFRNEKRKILRYLLAVALFLLILTPIAYLRIDAAGEDGFISHYFAGFLYVSDDLIEGTEADETWIVEGENNIPIFLTNGFSGLGKMLGLLLIPFFVLLIPLSLIVLFKKKYFEKIDYKTATIILITIILSLPAFYAFGRNLEDPRFLFVFLPFLCLLSLPIFKKIHAKFDHLQILTLSTVIAIIIISFLITEYEKIDYQYEQEVYEISQFVVKNADGVNAISPESRYFKTAELEMNWSNITMFNSNVDNSGHVSREINRIFAEEFETLNEFLTESKKNNITHLIVDGKENRANFLNLIYENDNNYPFLKMVYDSQQNGLNYHVKIYLIDYEHFDRIQNNDT